MIPKIRNRKRDLENLEGLGIIDYFKNVVNKNSKYTNSTQKVLDKFGNYPIEQLEIRRQPIVSAIDTALNVLSLNTWQKLKDKNSFDSLFHLFSIVTVLLPNGDKKKILLEKNQSINVSEKIPERQKETEILIIAIPKNTFTINSMLEKTLKDVGSDRFFVYRPFNDSDKGGNCQRFTVDYLRSNNLLGSRYESWILQDIEPLVKGLPNYVKKFSQTVTDFASKTEKILGLGQEGEEWQLHAVIVKKPVTPDELQKIHSEFIKGNKHFMRETKKSFRLRNLSKQKFLKGSFRTSLINKQISLVYGQLK